MPSLRNQLKTILSQYDALVEQNPHQLRLAIPSKEIWRFFIDGNKQESSRRLKFHEIFQTPFYHRFFYSNPLYYTIKDYIEKIEKVSLTSQSLYHKSGLMHFLCNVRWSLKPEDYHQLTLMDLINMDKVWLAFERNEPGCLKAFGRGFTAIFDLSKPLTLNFINHLHQLVTENVTHTEYDDANTKSKIGEFRLCPKGMYGLGKENTSEIGLLEFIRHIKNYSYTHSELYLYQAFGGSNGFKINTHFFRLVDSLNHDKLPSDKELCDFFIDCITAESEHLKNTYIRDALPLIKKIVSAKNDQAIAACLYQEICQFSFSSWFYQESEQAVSTNQTLTHIVQKLLDQYHQLIEKTDDLLCQLRVIINLIQSLEQLHPYVDANGRTFCMLLLNHLLIRNGFPLVILDDPNKFDLFGKNELLHEILNGMQNTLTLIKTGYLYQTKTDAVLNYLNNKPYFAKDACYFNEVVIAEENTRLHLIEEFPCFKRNLNTKLK